MKIIADGGASTKNVASNTMDAILLGLKQPYIDGYKFKLYLTKDNEIITLSEKSINIFNHIKNNTDDFTLKEYLLFNVGSQIQKQQILTLKEILAIFKSQNKILVLELTDQKKRNALFTNLVINTISSFNNIDIYLESESQEIVEYLKSTNNSFKTGIRVTEKSLNNWLIDVDFYDITINILSKANIREKIINNKLIMIDQINRQETFDLVYNEYQDIFNYIFIITSQISNINNEEIIRNNTTKNNQIS